MKQMSLIEMDGFLKGKCIPRDLKVNETNAEYLVRKFGELESKLGTALRECRSAGITIDNLEAKCEALAADNEKAMEAMRQADAAVKLAHEKFSALAAELQSVKVMNDCLSEELRGYESDGAFEGPKMHLLWWQCETPNHEAFLAEVRAQGVKMVADILKVAGVCEHTYLDAANELAAQLRKGGNQ